MQMAVDVRQYLQQTILEAYESEKALAPWSLPDAGNHDYQSS